MYKWVYMVATQMFKEKHVKYYHTILNATSDRDFIEKRVKNATSYRLTAGTKKNHKNKRMAH